MISSQAVFAFLFRGAMDDYNVMFRRVMIGAKIERMHIERKQGQLISLVLQRKLKLIFVLYDFQPTLKFVAVFSCG